MEAGTAIMAQESPMDPAYARRAHLLEELADSLSLASSAIRQANLPVLENQTSRQRVLVQRLSFESGEQFPAADRATDGQWIQELARIEAKVARLNRVHAALIRRARRTVDIFCRVLNHSGTTYPPPAIRPATEGAPKE